MAHLRTPLLGGCARRIVSVLQYSNSFPPMSGRWSFGLVRSVMREHHKRSKVQDFFLRFQSPSIGWLGFPHKRYILWRSRISIFPKIQQGVSLPERHLIQNRWDMCLVQTVICFMFGLRFGTNFPLQKIFMCINRIPKRECDRSFLHLRLCNLVCEPLMTSLRTVEDEWIAEIQKTAERRMKVQRLGVSIVSLEVLDLKVPSAVRSDFQSVQSAVVDAQTLAQEAKAYRAEKIPKARSWASNETNAAQSDALSQIALARAESSAFLALITDDPTLLKTRIYRERLKTIFSDIGSVRFVPPPPKSGMRITIQEGR